MDERHSLERKLKRIDRTLQVARHIAEGMVWEPNPELVHLLARAIDEARGLIGSLDSIMAAQIEGA